MTTVIVSTKPTQAVSTSRPNAVIQSRGGAQGRQGDPGPAWDVSSAIAASTGLPDAGKVTKTNDQGDLDRSFMPPGVPDETTLPDFRLLFENGLV
jgi:hypothetical protein